MTGSSPSIEGSATPAEPEVANAHDMLRLRRSDWAPWTCQLRLSGDPPEPTSRLGRSANISRAFMVIDSIHPRIGEATRRCVQQVYKHCWKCRDVACHTKVPLMQIYLPCMPLELFKRLYVRYLVET
jgi:hypothetical protein